VKLNGEWLKPFKFLGLELDPFNWSFKTRSRKGVSVNFEGRMKELYLLLKTYSSADDIQDATQKLEELRKTESRDKLES